MSLFFSLIDYCYYMKQGATKVISFQFVCMQNFLFQYGNDLEGHLEYAYFWTKIIL